MTTFGLVPHEQWGFGPKVDAEQLTRLHQPVGYEDILARLIPTLTLRERLQPKIEEPVGFTRVVLTLAGPSDLIELWYSGRGGYRAQYHLSPGRGAAANALMVDRVLIHFRDELTAWLALSHRPLFDTLTPCMAKVWIHEGEWYRTARWADVPEFLRRAPTPPGIEPKRAQKLRLKGAQAPAGETRLVLKGPWVGDADNVAHLELSKPHRALEIQHFRFT